MTNWTVRAYSESFSIETPTGEHIAHVDPYERGGYLVPLDHVRGVALRDLVRALRSEHACDKMMISRQREQWFDLDTASPRLALTSPWRLVSHVALRSNSSSTKQAISLMTTTTLRADGLPLFLLH